MSLSHPLFFSYCTGQPQKLFLVTKSLQITNSNHFCGSVQQALLVLLSVIVVIVVCPSGWQTQLQTIQFN